MNRIFCGGLILAGYQHPPSGGQKENKMEKIMGWDEDSLIRKPKAMCERGKKKEVYSPFHASRQIDVRWISGSGELVHMAIPSEGKHHHPKYPSLLLPTLPFMMNTVWNIFWVSSDQVPQCLPSEPLACLQPFGLLSGGLERQPWCCVSSAQQ